MTAPAVDAASALALSFGQASCSFVDAAPGVLGIPVPCLRGRDHEALLRCPPGTPITQMGSFRVQKTEEGIAGISATPISGDLEEVSYRLYQELFALLEKEGQFGHRLWHYVPDINGTVDGLENYRVFNIGRRRAFDDHFGGRAESLMPAASAVGCHEQHLVFAFVGGKERPAFIENPLQTPAYHYPASYGPKTPSFARATVVGNQVYVSGTASIQGHESLHVGDLAGQFEVTWKNLQTLIETVGEPSWDAVTQRPGYRLKVYLRRSEDLPSIWGRLEETLGATEDNAIILQAAICRSDLDLEIEAMFLTNCLGT